MWRERERGNNKKGKMGIIIRFPHTMKKMKEEEASHIYLEIKMERKKY